MRTSFHLYGLKTRAARCIARATPGIEKAKALDGALSALISQRADELHPPGFGRQSKTRDKQGLMRCRAHTH